MLTPGETTVLDFDREPTFIPKAMEDRLVEETNALILLWKNKWEGTNWISRREFLSTFAQRQWLQGPDRGFDPAIPGFTCQA
ncbi:MAG: hypothetical protein CME05_02190 [Gemmatimonadaceae bacterium]|nr:hypothetical protein [Gemmatimonadaceae bacterium]